MISISKILRLEFNSSFLRYLLSFYYKPNQYYKIPVGHLKGVRIWYDHSINYHAMLGLWERNNFDLFDKIVKRLLASKPELTVYDIGANIGLFGLFFTRFEAKINVVCFEAAPDTSEKLRRNVAANAVPNVAVVDKAVSNEDGQVSFFVAHHHKSSLVHSWASDRGVSEVEKITVPAIKLDTYSAENPGSLPDIIKIDVEGGGDRVLEGAMEIIRRKRPIILFESHLPGEDDAVIELLRKHRYKAYRTTNLRWVVNEQENYRDPEGVWGTMILFPAEDMAMFRQLLK